MRCPVRGEASASVARAIRVPRAAHEKLRFVHGLRSCGAVAPSRISARSCDLARSWTTRWSVRPVGRYRGPRRGPAVDTIRMGGVSAQRIVPWMRNGLPAGAFSIASMPALSPDVRIAARLTRRCRRTSASVVAPARTSSFVTKSFTSLPFTRRCQVARGRDSGGGSDRTVDRDRDGSRLCEREGARREHGCGHGHHGNGDRLRQQRHRSFPGRGEHLEVLADDGREPHEQGSAHESVADRDLVQVG